MGKLAKILCLATSIGVAIGTTPIALSMLPSDLHSAYIGFKIYLFVAVPLIWLWVIEKEEKSRRE